MKNKFLLSMGTVAAAAIPMITVVACAKEEAKTPIEQQLDKIQNTTPTKSLAALNTYLNELTVKTAGTEVDAADMGISLTVDDGYTVVYTLKAEWVDDALTTGANTIVLTATVTKTDDTTQTGTKDITLTVDVVAPTVTPNTGTAVLGGNIVVKESENDTLALTVPAADAPTVDEVKAEILALLTANDNIDGAIDLADATKVTINWAEFDLTPNQTTTLTVTVKDAVENSFDYKLDITVTTEASE